MHNAQFTTGDNFSVFPVPLFLFHSKQCICRLVFNCFYDNNCALCIVNSALCEIFCLKC